MVKPPCSRCKILKGESWDEEICSVCLPPLMPENEDATQIFSITQNQLIMGPGGPIDINQTAIHEAMKLYQVQNRRECFEKVLTLSGYFLGKIRKKVEQDRQ